MNGQFRIWTPVANALEAYKRRLLRDIGATYEHIWRLIHIHEALVATLGASLVTRLLQEWQNDSKNQGRLNRLRSMITGLPETDENAVAQPVSESCFSGSIKAWIDVLQVFGKSEGLPDCNYCQSLAAYLSHKVPEKPLYFLEAWKRVAQVPSAYCDILPRVQRFDAINALRNKLAHVPLPERILSDLHKGLRVEVLSSLSPKYDPDKDSMTDELRITQWHQPLCGRILTRDLYLTGSDYGRCNEPPNDGGEYTWLQPMPSSESNAIEPWKCDPFLKVDGECKVSLLFRIPDLELFGESVPGEYHRFAAEIEPVQRNSVPTTVLKPWISQPAISKETITLPEISGDEASTVGAHFETGEKETPSPQETIESTIDTCESPDQLRTIAETAFGQREYGVAVKAFKALADKNISAKYNDVAKSKHGAALWRFALSEENLTQEVRIEYIKQSIQLLKQATQHVDPRYQARAYYEMSKASYHLWELTSEDVQLQCASKHAQTAVKTDYESAYVTWLERIQEEIANVSIKNA